MMLIRDHHTVKVEQKCIVFSDLLKSFLRKIGKNIDFGAGLFNPIHGCHIMRNGIKVIVPIFHIFYDFIFERRFDQNGLLNNSLSVQDAQIPLRPYIFIIEKDVSHQFMILIGNADILHKSGRIIVQQNIPEIKYNGIQFLMIFFQIQHATFITSSSNYFSNNHYRVLIFIPLLLQKTRQK